jgi:D-3-phosphoglycerate dehydrogenase
MTKIWTNTKTLDGYIDDLCFTDNKEDADLALIGGKTIDPAEFPNLKLIFRTGISKDNLPFESAKERGIRIELPSETVQNYIYEETADFTCFLIMKMLYSNVGTIIPWKKNGRGSLKNKTLLLIGLGKIGKKVADKMSSFMNVVTYDILINTKKELFDFIQDADCISLHIPNSKENEGIFNKEKLSLMKDNAILINTARGPIVNEEDLYRELSAGRLKAAFDVYWQEPYSGKLSELTPEYFSMTPHIASTCNEFLSGAAKDLRRLIGEIENV